MGTGNPAGAGSAAGEVEAGPRAAPAPLGLLLHRPPAGQGAEGPWVHAANLPPTCSRLMLCGPGAWGSAASSPEQGPPERSPCRFSPVSAWTSQGESAGSQGSLLRMPPRAGQPPFPAASLPPTPPQGSPPGALGPPKSLLHRRPWRLEDATPTPPQPWSACPWQPSSHSPQTGSAQDPLRRGSG